MTVFGSFEQNLHAVISIQQFIGFIINSCVFHELDLNLFILVIWLELFVHTKVKIGARKTNNQRFFILKHFKQIIVYFY